MRPPFEGQKTALAILSAPLLAPYLRPLEILQPMPFPRSQVGRKTPVLRPTCDLQFMRWNRTIYFSRKFSCHGNAQRESEMLSPSPNLLLFFATLLPPPHRIRLVYRCRCHLHTFVCRCRHSPPLTPPPIISIGRHPRPPQPQSTASFYHLHLPYFHRRCRRRYDR